MNVRLLQTQPASFNLQNRSSFLLHFPDKLKRFIPIVLETFREKAKKDYSTILPCEFFWEKKHRNICNVFILRFWSLEKNVKNGVLKRNMYIFCHLGRRRVVGSTSGPVIYSILHADWKETSHTIGCWRCHHPPSKAHWGQSYSEFDF